MENIQKNTTKSPVERPMVNGQHEPKEAKQKHAKSEKAADASKTSDATKVDQKQGTAIGQNPDEPDRFVA